MPKVFDAQTSAPITDASPEDVHAGILSGKYGLDADAGPVTLAGKDGKIYKAAPDQVAKSLATGAYRLLSPDEEIKHQTEQAEKAKGLIGSIESGAESFGNQALLGLPNELLQSHETHAQQVQREAAESYHSTARLLGGAGGVGASLLAGGAGLFKGAALAGEAVEHGILPAAEAAADAVRATEAAGGAANAVAKASLATKLAAKAANAATQGVVISSPSALIQAASGDPKKAAETLMWGVGAGALLGGGAELLSSGASAAGEAVASKLQSPETAKWLDNWANERTLKAFGAERSQLNKLGKDRMADLANFAHEEGLIKPGMSRQDLGDVVERAQDKWGKNIGDTIDSLDTILHRGEGAAIGPKPPPEILEAALKPGQLGDSIRSNLDLPEMRMPMNADQASALKMVADSADALPTIDINGERVVPFKDAQKFVSDLRKKWVTGINRSANDGGVKGLETVTALDRMKESAYQYARDTVHAAADAVAAASGEPQMVGALAKAKMQYAKLSQLEQFASTLDRVKAGNRMVGLTDMIHMGQGPASAASTALGAAIGSFAGPGGAIVGSQIGRIPGIALDFMAKKWMEDKGLVAISALAKRAAKEGPEVFSAVMASEGAKRLAATMQGVQQSVKNMAMRGLVGTTASSVSDHMTHLLGGASGLSSGQQYEKLGARLNALASNPESMIAATSAASAPFAAGSPDLGAAYQAQLHQTLQYLHDALPKPPGPPPPFAPDDWEPTEQEKMAFHDKAEIVNNPMRAMHHVERGTLSDAHVESMQANYPRVLDEMRSTALQVAADHPDLKLPLPERQSLAKLLGVPLDNISEHLAALQATYTTAATGSSAHPPPGTRAPKGKIKNMPNAASAFSGSQGPNSTGA